MEVLFSLVLQQYVRDISTRFTCKSAGIDQNIISCFIWTIDLWTDGYTRVGILILATLL